MNVGIEEAGEEEPGEGSRGGRNLRYHPVLVEYSPRVDFSRDDVDDVAFDRLSHATVSLSPVFLVSRNCEKIAVAFMTCNFMIPQNGCRANPGEGA